MTDKKRAPQFRFSINEDGSVTFDNLDPEMLEVARALNPDDEDLAFRQHCLLPQDDEPAQNDEDL